MPFSLENQISRVLIQPKKLSFEDRVQLIDEIVEIIRVESFSAFERGIIKFQTAEQRIFPADIQRVFNQYWKGRTIA